MVIDSKNVGTASIKSGLPRQAEAAIALVDLVTAITIALAAIVIAVS